MTSQIDLIARIDALLPQTQCEQCGYKGCEAYATALAQGAARINQCPPGGKEGIARLADLLGLEVLEPDTTRGIQVPFEVAQIEEAQCIGCCLCLAACPTEAIIGNPKHLHRVDIERCTGCALCTMCCPVDCIEMVRTGSEWTSAQADAARTQFRAKKNRLTAKERAREEKLQKQSGHDAKKKFLDLLKKKNNLG